MSTTFLVLAGPQAAGKSTAQKTICADEPSTIPLQESRQIVVHRNHRKGAIFMTRDDELEVIHNDMHRMFRIIGEGDPGRVYLDETNIFTLGHALAHGIDLLDGYFRQYVDLLARLRAAVLFIDVPSDVSWERRRARYVHRLCDHPADERDRLLDWYRSYLDRLYPKLVEIFERLDLPKIRVNGCGSFADTTAAIAKAYRQLCLPEVNEEEAVLQESPVPASE